VAAKFPVGSSASGEVTRVEAYGAFVALAPGLEGLVHISKMSADRRLTHARQAVSAGQKVDVTVVSVDPDQRRLSLSMVEEAVRAREKEAADDRREHERVMSEQHGKGSLGTLGDLLEAARRK
jgi:small subunit ribosomal protein S1